MKDEQRPPAHQLLDLSPLRSRACPRQTTTTTRSSRSRARARRLRRAAAAADARSTATGSRSASSTGKAAVAARPATRQASSRPAPISAGIDPMSRRNFFHLMGASAGARRRRRRGCQRYEKEEIVPLARRPEDQTPGTTLQYATAYELGGVAHPLLATSYEGRPIHLDGNPEHPFAGGGIVPGTEASRRRARRSRRRAILHLYDPDRSQSPTAATARARRSTRSRPRSPTLPQDARRRGARILSEATSSPTVRALKRAAARATRACGGTSTSRCRGTTSAPALQLAFGRPCGRSRSSTSARRSSRSTATCSSSTRRRCATAATSRAAAASDGSLGIGKMNRLWAVESVFTNTGAIADHRLPLRSRARPAVRDGARRRARRRRAAAGASSSRRTKVAKFLAALAEELKANRGKAVVIAGRRQPPEVHALVAKINADDRRARHDARLRRRSRPGSPDARRSRSPRSRKDMTRGHGPDARHPRRQPGLRRAGRPRLRGRARARSPTSIHLSEYDDETSQKSHVARAARALPRGVGRRCARGTARSRSRSR